MMVMKKRRFDEEGFVLGTDGFFTELTAEDLLDDQQLEDERFRREHGI